LRDTQSGEFAMKSTAFPLVFAAVSMFAIAPHAETIDPAQAIAQKFSEANEIEAAPPKRSFVSPGSDYESDMLARARAEEFERQQKKAQQANAKPKEAQPAIPEIVASPPQAALQPTKLAALPPKPAAEPPASPLPHADAPRPTATAAAVLLVLDPDGSGLKFKPDPILCIDENCWLSNGISSPALRMPKSQAVVLDGTENITAGSCSGKSGCVYRNVTIDPTARVEVIEVGEGNGASAGAYTIAADETCRKQGNTMVCSNGMTTEKYRIWIVPEATAEAAGASSLENALAEGLPEAEVTSANDK
jgi:hypothetical protein